MKNKIGNLYLATPLETEIFRLICDTIELKKQITVLVSIAFIIALTQSQHQHKEVYPLTIQNGEWENPMEMDARNMHRYCHGACGYGPKGCRDNLLCRVIISVTKFKPPCDSTAAKEMCIPERADNLYMISVLRMIPPKVVNNYTADSSTSVLVIDSVETRCEVRPFVAFAFAAEPAKEFIPWTGSSEGSMNASESAQGDIIYVCISEFPYVTTWAKISKEARRARMEDTRNSTCLGTGVKKDQYVQIKDTQPYPGQGVAVMWSKINTRLEQFAMSCKVVISNVTSDLTFTLPEGEGEEEAEFFKFADVSFKIATGFAYLRNGEIERVVFGNKKKPAYILVETTDDANIYSLPSVVKGWEGNYKLMGGIHEKNKTVEFDTREASVEAVDEFNRVHQMCDKKLAMCYFLHDEENCIHKASCHFLVAIQATEDFKTLKFYLMFQPLRIEGHKQLVHPQGYAAIGFSNDTFMGEDLVILCVAQGNTPNAILTLNIVQNNEFVDSEDYRGDPPDFNFTGYYLNMETETAMCVVELGTEDIIIRSFTNSPPETDIFNRSAWPELHFYLQNHEFYVLLAQGTRISGESKITYHAFRKVSEKLFSKEHYYKFVNNGYQFLPWMMQAFFMSVLVILDIC